MILAPNTVYSSRLSRIVNGSNRRMNADPVMRDVLLCYRKSQYNLLTTRMHPTKVSGEWPTLPYGDNRNHTLSLTHIDMYQEIFEELSMSPNEAKIYEALLEHGESSVSAIAVAAKIHRRNAYDAIHRLIDKGLCFQIFSSSENRYNAVDPNKLLELHSERQKQLEEVLPALKKKFTERFAPEEAYIYRGLEGQKNIWRDVLRVGKDSYAIGAKAGWFDPRLDKNTRGAFFKEANRKKIKFIQLFDYEVKEQIPQFPKDFPGMLQYRILPKEFSTNSLIHIFGDYVVTYAGLTIGKIDENNIFFVLHSKDLAESYRKWFWCMWAQSTEDKN